MRTYLNVEISKGRRMLAREASTSLVIRDSSYCHKYKEVWEFTAQLLHVVHREGGGPSGLCGD